MVSLIANVLALSITIPIVITFVVYFVSYKWLNNKRKALHIAVDYTALLYILAVVTLSYVLFERALIAIICLICLSVLLVIGIYEWKMTGNIAVQRTWRIAWRFMFLLFSALYMMLFLFGFTKAIFFA